MKAGPIPPCGTHNQGRDRLHPAQRPLVESRGEGAWKEVNQKLEVAICDFKLKLIAKRDGFRKLEMPNWHLKVIGENL